MSPDRKKGRKPFFEDMERVGTHKIVRPGGVTQDFSPPSAVQQYNVGEKPAVIQLTNINRHAGTPNKTKQCSTN